MKLFLKIIYIAYQRTRNRKENVINAFAALLTFYMMTLIVFISIIILRKVIQGNYEVSILSKNFYWLIFAIIMAIGILIYFTLKKYALKIITNHESYLSHGKISTTIARLIIFLLALMTPLTIIVSIFIINKTLS